MKEDEKQHENISGPQDSIASGKSYMAGNEGFRKKPKT